MLQMQHQALQPESFRWNVVFFALLLMQHKALQPGHAEPDVRTSLLFMGKNIKTVLKLYDSLVILK